MITHEEWKKRMNGRHGGSTSVYPCDPCIIPEGGCPCDLYRYEYLVDHPGFKKLSEEDQNLFRISSQMALLRIPDSRIGYPCETLNRWLFGLDDEVTA